MASDRRGSRWGVCALLFGALLAGCGGDDPSLTSGDADGAPAVSSPASTVPAPADYQVSGPVVAAPTCGRADGDCDPGDAGYALAEVRIEDGCVFLRTKADGRSVAVLWPTGTTSDPTSADVVLPDGEPVGNGDLVDAGGGEGSEATLATFYPGLDVPPMLLACAGRDGIDGFLHLDNVTLISG